MYFELAFKLQEFIPQINPRSMCQNIISFVCFEFHATCMYNFFNSVLLKTYKLRMTSFGKLTPFAF